MTPQKITIHSDAIVRLTGSLLIPANMRPTPYGVIFDLVEPRTDKLAATLELDFVESLFAITSADDKTLLAGGNIAELGLAAAEGETAEGESDTPQAEGELPETALFAVPVYFEDPTDLTAKTIAKASRFMIFDTEAEAQSFVTGFMLARTARNCELLDVEDNAEVIGRMLRRLQKNTAKTQATQNLDHLDKSLALACPEHLGEMQADAIGLDAGEYLADALNFAYGQHIMVLESQQ